MFEYTGIFSSFSVDDLQKARDFYHDTLGPDVSETPGMDKLLTLRAGKEKRILIYAKPDHIPATFTILNFIVEDAEKTVDKLTAQGVHFERYDDRLKTDEKGIFRDNGPLIAWLKDPAGNILSVLEDRQ